MISSALYHREAERRILLSRLRLRRWTPCRPPRSIGQGLEGRHSCRAYRPKFLQSGDGRAENRQPFPSPPWRPGSLAKCAQTVDDLSGSSNVPTAFWRSSLFQTFCRSWSISASSCRSRVSILPPESIALLRTLQCGRGRGATLADESLRSQSLDLLVRVVPVLAQPILLRHAFPSCRTAQPAELCVPYTTFSG
jgi:hypothetical protein